ncbi:MAG: endonuclease/exonuclease/phosphatase family protein [Anaerolineales bacterium]|nr:endonuclease/exonuclease/phosphatase family protein [Anaerolineales bacterium]
MLTSILDLILWAAVILLCVATLGGFLGRIWWRFELLSHFRLQYLVLLTLLGLIFALRGQTVGALLGKIFALLNLVLILPLYLPQRKPQRASRTCRVFLANVLGQNSHYHRLIQSVQASQADLLVFVETNTGWMAAIQPALQETYPHCYAEVREDNYGIVIFSRLPLQHTKTHWFGPANVPTLVASLEWEGKALTLIATHPPPPKAPHMTRQRDAQLNELADFASRQESEILLLGDLNTTSWSDAFRNLLRESRLHDSRRGFGIQPTWPAHSPLFLIPLDHILHSAGIHIHQRKVLAAIGSDHLPVLLDFSIPSPEKGIK